MPCRPAAPVAWVPVTVSRHASPLLSVKAWYNEDMRLPDSVAILLVEDREDDVLLIRRSLRGAGIHNPLFFARDGEEAVAYLEGTGQFRDRNKFPLPELILLDLKMPKMDGFEVLAWIRAQPHLNALRIIVLTSSEDVYDVNRAYELGANSFLVKPHEISDFQALMRSLGSFWLRYSQAPTIALEKPSKDFPRL